MKVAIIVTAGVVATVTLVDYTINILIMCRQAPLPFIVQVSVAVLILIRARQCGRDSGEMDMASVGWTNLGVAEQEDLIAIQMNRNNAEA